MKELQELSQALAQVGGKHVYSYLPKSVKAQVDAIVERLAQLPEVAACYEQWWKLKDEIAGYYGRNTPPHLPLTQRKEFRSLKNWIIREAENTSFSMSADSTEPEEKQSAEKKPPIRGSVDVQPVGEAVSARHIPTNAVMRLLHHMGQIFRTSMPVIPPALRIDSKPVSYTHLSSPDTLGITCYVDGEVAGNCESSFRGGMKTSHRATIAIAILKDYWNLGIGSAMFEELVAAAQNRGCLLYTSRCV